MSTYIEVPLVPTARGQTLKPGLWLARQDGGHTTGLDGMRALPRLESVAGESLEKQAEGSPR